jgi:DNA-binding PadR family transcriptional regulator
MLVIKRTARPAGSVYPILERLEGAGWVASIWEPDTERSGPRRRLYELTHDGATAAQAAVARFEEDRLERATPTGARRSRGQGAGRLAEAGA